jgi:complex iron-sulfur molybdoenzyme family reductase subunit beta
VVLVDRTRCQGHRYCVAGCPYKKIYFNPDLFRSEKCIFCFPRVEKGLAPACAQQCVGRMRWVGYLDDEAGQVHRLVRRWQVALPLHPEYGTQPNVFYVPPLPGPPRLDGQGKPIPGSERIPVAYLESLFGKGVRQALAMLEAEMAKRRAGKPSALLETLIAFRHADMFRLGEPSAPGLVQLGRRGIRSVEVPSR